MDIETTRVPTTRMPWRQLGVLALIALLLATAIAFYVGTRQPRVPAPFGRAENGLIAYDFDGDLHLVDAKTGDVGSIIATKDREDGPRFSRDGTHIVFRRITGGGSDLFVTDTNGTAPTRITTSPILLTSSLLGEPWDQYQFSPDGSSVVIAATVDGVESILIAQSDGSGVRRLDLGIRAYEPSFRPPDGREIMFVGTGQSTTGIYVFDVGSNKLRTIVQLPAGYDLAGANWSPDGSRIAFWEWGGQATGINAQTHVIAADGSGDRELPMPSGFVWNAGSEWSNDGTRIAIIRGRTDDTTDARGAAAPADGSSPGTEWQFDGTLNGACCAAFEWSPDDASILVTPSDGAGNPLPQTLVDVASGRSKPATWITTSDPTWQRLAAD